jgi:hypothetical protein
LPLASLKITVYASKDTFLQHTTLSHHVQQASPRFKNKRLPTFTRFLCWVKKKIGIFFFSHHKKRVVIPWGGVGRPLTNFSKF